MAGVTREKMELRAEQIAKWYFRKTGESNRFFAVKETSLTLEAGKLTVLMGRSGSGKTTLLHLLGGLLRPDAGRVLAVGAGQDTDLYALDDAALSRFRNQYISLIPQGQSGVHSLTVLENVMLPRLMYQRRSKGRTSQKGAGEKQSSVEAGMQDTELEAQAMQYLERFGIAELAGVFPKELSGGEARRMAVARALLGGASVILADEPTGDLDDENTMLVMQAFREAADGGAAVLIATHEAEALSCADRKWSMQAGCLGEN